MKSALDILSKMILDETFEKCVFSSPRDKNGELQNATIYSVKSNNEVKLELKYKKHNDIRTISKSNLLSIEIDEYLKMFKQCHVKTVSENVQILLNKKFESKIISKKVEANQASKHNRNKNYLIPDGVICPFLQAIGVMDKAGNVKSNYYKKFKQINRFLELVDDLYKDEGEQALHVVDFGCGKSYLTFALYHYFHNIKGIKASITGIDLKQEVIDHCNSIAKEVSFDDLKFVHGFIHEFSSDQPVNFVVTLHACDTATDDAILFSLKHQAKKMMFVPCCQHELNTQIKNNTSDVMLKHGIFKDRMTAIITDSMRAQLLELSGYKVQVMEFIDLEHTAKNVLLRCSLNHKSEAQKQDIKDKYQAFKGEWQIEPYLEEKIKQLNPS